MKLHLLRAELRLLRWLAAYCTNMDREFEGLLAMESQLIKSLKSSKDTTAAVSGSLAHCAQGEVEQLEQLNHQIAQDLREYKRRAATYKHRAKVYLVANWLTGRTRNFPFKVVFGVSRPNGIGAPLLFLCFLLLSQEQRGHFAVVVGDLSEDLREAREADAAWPHLLTLRARYASELGGLLGRRIWKALQALLVIKSLLSGWR